MARQALGMKTPDSRLSKKAPAPPDIPALLVEAKASGLSLASVARQNGVHPCRLYYAKKRLAETGSGPTALVPVRIVDKSEPGALDLRFPAGYSLAVPRDFDAGHLHRLLEVLSSC